MVVGAAAVDGEVVAAPHRAHVADVVRRRAEVLVLEEGVSVDRRRTEPAGGPREARDGGPRQGVRLAGAGVPVAGAGDAGVAVGALGWWLAAAITAIIKKPQTL